MSDQPNVRGPRRQATYKDVLAAPENMVAELIDGELILSPRPARKHARFASRLYGELYDPFQRGRSGPGGWVFLFEPELHFGKQIVIPDVAGWRAEHAEPDDDRAFYSVAPDWVCEVLSPGTAAFDRTRKLPIYAKQGVGHVWLADPVLRTLEVLALQDGRWLLLAAYLGDEKVRAPPFETLDLDLSPLWSP